MVTVRFLADLINFRQGSFSYEKENFSCFIQRTSAKHVVFPRIFLEENDGHSRGIPSAVQCASFSFKFFLSWNDDKTNGRLLNIYTKVRRSHRSKLQWLSYLFFSIPLCLGIRIRRINYTERKLSLITVSSLYSIYSIVTLHTHCLLFKLRRLSQYFVTFTIFHYRIYNILFPYYFSRVIFSRVILFNSDTVCIIVSELSF